MKAFLKRLNGWQRLFAGFMLFIYTPFALISLFNADYTKQIRFGDFLGSISQELSTSIQKGESILINSSAPADQAKFYKKRYVRFTNIGSVDPNFQFDLYVSRKVEASKANELANKFTEALKSYVFKTMFMGRIWGVSLFIFLGSLLYLFFWTIGGILEVFRNS